MLFLSEIRAQPGKRLEGKCNGAVTQLPRIPTPHRRDLGGAAAFGAGCNVDGPRAILWRTELKVPPRKTKSGEPKTCWLRRQPVNRFRRRIHSKRISVRSFLEPRILDITEDRLFSEKMSAMEMVLPGLPLPPVLCCVYCASGRNAHAKLIGSGASIRSTLRCGQESRKVLVG